MSYYSPYTFEKQEECLFLNYTLDKNRDWVQEKIKRDGCVPLKGIFAFSQDDFYEDETVEPEDVFSDEKTYVFMIGVPVGEYYKITKIKNLQHDLYIHRDVNITINTFLYHKISIFHIIDKTIDHDLYIGGQNEIAISISEFNKLLKEFPNDYEITKYRTARISAIIKENIDLKKDYQLEFEKYLNKRVISKPPHFINDLSSNEITKYSLIKNKDLVIKD